MIDVKKDTKSHTWTVTNTDSEGFHRTISITREDMGDLLRKIKDIYGEEEVHPRV